MWSSSVSASLISQSIWVTVFPADTNVAQPLFSTLPQVSNSMSTSFRGLIIIGSSGSVSSPSYGLKDRSTNEGYHHTDCLWIASVKPTEIWVATIFTPHQGIRCVILLNVLNVISHVYQVTVRNGMSHCISTTINGRTSWVPPLMSSALTKKNMFLPCPAESA